MVQQPQVFEREKKNNIAVEEWFFKEQKHHAENTRLFFGGFPKEFGRLEESRQRPSNTGYGERGVGSRLRSIVRSLN